MFGIGEYGIGGFADSDSVSIADPLPGLISDPSLAREFLLRSNPVGGAVDLSSSGYASKPTDVPYQLFPSAISRPYNFNVELPLPNLTGGASLGVGEILVKNSDGLHDTDATKDWLGADADVYIGRKDASLNDFTRFARGKSAGVTWDLESFSILHRDLRFKLQKRLQQHRYKGYGAAVRGDGASGYLTGPVSFPAGSMALEVLVRPLANYALGSFVPVAGWRNGSLAGLRLIDLGALTSNGFSVVVRNDAATVFRIGSTTSYVVGESYRVSLVIDLVSMLLIIYVNGIPEGSIAITGTFNTVLSAFALCRYPDLAVFSNVDVDDIRIWSGVKTPAQILETSNTVLKGTETGLVYYNKLDEGALTTANPTVGTGALTLTGGDPAIKWVGSLEGDASLVGTPKPIALGIKRQVSPKLVDPQRRVYQLHDGSMFAIDAVKDGGDPYIFGADVSDIYATTPAAGSYNTCLAKGLFRLGSSPVGVVTCDIRGDNSAPLGYVDDLSNIHRKVVTKYGGQTDGDLNLGTYVTLGSKATADIGFYFDSEINVDAVLDEIMKKGGSGWWTPDRVGRVSVGRVDNPATLEPDLTVTLDDLVDPKKGGTFKRSPVGVRIGQVVLGYRRYNTKLSEDQVATSLSLATRLDLGQEYRFVTSPPNPNMTGDVDTMTVYTEIDDPVAAQAEADRLYDLWKVDRATLRVTMDQGVLSYFIGTVFNVLINRYDMTTGKKMIVFGIAEDMGQYGATDRLEPALFG